MRIRFRHIFDGEIVETDVITCSRDQWAARPESRDKSWSVVNLPRARVQAVQLCLPVNAFKPTAASK